MAKTGSTVANALKVKHVTAWVLDHNGKYAGKMVCTWTNHGLIGTDISISGGPLPFIHNTTEKEAKSYLEGMGYTVHDMS